MSKLNNYLIDRYKFTSYTPAHMANTKSAIKRIRRISKQTVVNKARKSRYRNAIKKMNLFSISNRILIANKSCIAERPSWITCLISKTVQLKNRLCEQDIIILQS